MAHRKAGGSAKNLSDSNPKYLGVKVNHGQTIKAGGIIVRQRGTKFVAGDNTRVSKDHTIFALADGKVEMKNIRKKAYDGKVVIRKKVSVI